ncbi:hypothetical protein [Thermaurantiacus sp.]
MIGSIRRRRPLAETTGGPLLVVRSDGALLRGGFRTFPLGPDRVVRWTSIGTHDGAGLENWQLSDLSLRADGAVFAVSTIEYFRGGFDMRVTVHDSWTGAVLFWATDNSHPLTIWRGDEPDMPEPLREEQAFLDRYWEENLRDNPDAPRPIAEASFADPASDGELFFGGWTAAGHILLAGRSRLEIRSTYHDRAQVTEPEPWWGAAGPVASGRWGWLERGHGAPPAIHAAVPTPPLARNVAILGEQLRVDGVAQTDAALSAGVLAVDGPLP